MSDLINRKTAVQGVKELFSMGECYCDELSIIGMLNSLPSQPKWIPVTERLPKTNGCYLVWRPHFFNGKIGMPAICYFDGKDTWHDAYGVDFSRVLHEKDVTAWMLLPEPWRGE